MVHVVILQRALTLGGNSGTWGSYCNESRPSLGVVLTLGGYNSWQMAFSLCILVLYNHVHMARGDYTKGSETANLNLPHLQVC